VAAQRDDPASMLSFTRRAIWFRKASAALVRGDIRILDAGPGAFAYLRETADERLAVALEFSGRSRRVDVRSALAAAGRPASAGTLVLGTEPGSEAPAPVDLATVELPGDAGIVIRLA
jgi:glycosidase